MPIVSGGGGGGSAPIQTRSIYFGTNLLIDNGATDTLTWDSQQAGGSSLLDITTPAVPTAVAAGVYSVAVFVLAAAPMTAGGWFQVRLELDFNGDDAELITTSPAATATLTQPEVALTLVYFLPVGGVVKLRVGNFDGVQNLNFFMSYGNVQRLS